MSSSINTCVEINIFFTYNKAKNIIIFYVFIFKKYKNFFEFERRVNEQTLR